MNNTLATIGTFTGTGAGVRYLDISGSKLNITGTISGTVIPWNYSGTNLSLFAEHSRINMTGTNNGFTGINTHTYDSLVYEKKGTIANGTTVNTLILAPNFDGTNATFAFPSNGTVTVNRKIVTGGTPCDMVILTSTTTGTAANLNVPKSSYNIDLLTPIGFELHFARAQYLNVVEGDNQAKIRLSSQSYENVAGSNTGGWEIVNTSISDFKGLEGVSLGEDTSMWCNATFPINTDHFYGDHNTTYLWSDGSIDNHLVISEFGEYWVQVNYSANCSTYDTIFIMRDSNIYLTPTLTSTGSQAKVSLSTSGRAALDPSPFFVLDSVQPSQAMTGLPLSQQSPDFYFSVPVKAFFSFTDALTGCSDSCMISTPLIAVNDTSFMKDDTTVSISLMDNDLYLLEAGICTSASTVLSNQVSAQHGSVLLRNDTLYYTPDAGWSGLDSLSYVLIACNERDTAMVYFITVRDTFDACNGVEVTLTLPDILGMTYTWYDPQTSAVVSTTTNNTYTLTKGGVEDLSVWWIEAQWNGSKLQPILSLCLVNGSASTSTHILGFSGDTLIANNTTAALQAIASAEVINPVFHWYGQPTGGTPFYVGDEYTTSTLTQDTTFYVAISGNNFCSSVERRVVTVHIIPPPSLVSDVFSTLINTTVMYDVLANDAIPSACSDPQIFPTYTQNTNGTASDENGELKYTPDIGFYGVAVLYYLVGCGSVYATSPAAVNIVVSKPVSAEYVACNGTSVRMGFNAITNVVYRWYDVEFGGNQLPVSSDTSISIVKDNSPSQSFWAEPVYNGTTVLPRIEVKMKLGDCGVTQPQGCALNGTVLYKEDYGGNDPNDPPKKPTGIPQVVGYGYTTGNLTANNYAINKRSIHFSGWAGWYSNIDDHTHPNDTARGYLIGFDASEATGQFYECKIDNLCAGSQLYISTWLANLHNKSVSDKPNVIFVIEDTINKTVLAHYYTGDVPDQDSVWKQYGFAFTLPDNVSSIKLRIINNGTGSASGNDFVMDDIEIRFCAPAVHLLQPTVLEARSCTKTSFTFEGEYTDDGTFTTGGRKLVYRWERNLTGDLNNPQAWLPIPSTENTSATNSITSSYSLANLTLSDTGYYRLAVANTVNIGNYYCRAMSEIISLQIDTAPVAYAQTKELCLGLMTKLITDTNVTGTWTSDHPAIADLIDLNTVKGISAGKAVLTFTLSSPQVCSVKDTVTVKDFPEVTPTTGKSVVCVGETIELSNDTQGGVWKHNNSNISLSDYTSNPVTVKGVTAGKSFVSYIVSDGACRTTETFRLKIISPQTSPPVIIIGIER
jgi:hypothetical protein